MAKIEGQLLDSNAVKIFKKKKKHADTGLNKCYRQYFHTASQTSLLCAHTPNKSQRNISVCYFIREHLCKKISITGSPRLMLPQTIWPGLILTITIFIGSKNFNAGLPNILTNPY